MANGPEPPDELAAQMREWLHAHMDRLFEEVGKHVPITMHRKSKKECIYTHDDNKLLTLLLRRVLDDELERFIEQESRRPEGIERFPRRTAASAQG